MGEVNEQKILDFSHHEILVGKISFSDFIKFGNSIEFTI